ncbi:MAG TPA: DUF4142 domain-containing protein [Polyangiaceae bacterium]
MNHFKSSLSTGCAIAVVLGMVACGGETSQQQPANAPVGTTTEYAQTPPSGTTPTEQSGQYGSAMNQPGSSTAAGEQPGAATAPSTMGGASGQLNPQGQGQYGQNPMGQTNEQSGQYGQSGATPGGATGGTAPGAGTMGSTSAMGGAMDVSSLNDAQLAAVIQAINQGEIQAAQLAEQKSTAPEVKRFARDMLTSHRNIMNEDQSVLSQAQITPSDNAVSQQLRTDAQGEMSTLEGMRGRDFDKEYVDEQIKDHNKAIELIDRIIPNIKNPQLKAQLQNARPRLEAHLREAERLQQKMQQGSTNKQSPSPSPNQNQNQNPNQNQQNQHNQQNQGGSQNPY